MFYWRWTSTKKENKRSLCLRCAQDVQIEREKQIYNVTGGCTALAVVYLQGKLYVANAGDSRCRNRAMKTWLPVCFVAQGTQFFFPMRLQSHYHKEQRHHPHVDRVHPRIWATATSVPGKKWIRKRTSPAWPQKVCWQKTIDWAKASVSQQHSQAQKIKSSGCSCYLYGQWQSAMFFLCSTFCVFLSILWVSTFNNIKINVSRNAQYLYIVYPPFTNITFFLIFILIHLDSKIQFFGFSSLVRAKERVNRPGTMISFNLGASPS